VHCTLPPSPNAYEIDVLQSVFRNAFVASYRDDSERANISGLDNGVRDDVNAVEREPRLLDIRYHRHSHRPSIISRWSTLKASLKS